MREQPAGPVPIQLEVGMLDMTFSLAESGQELSPDTDLILEHIKSNGLGITKLDKLSHNAYYIEHSPEASGTIIARYFGNLASQELGSVTFVRPDGRPHSIQPDKD